ncbi:MAG: hypothetical protein K1X31_02365 [Gemmatimonadaceae bacterium]|nr:hypothetical protein [Gemmatimonadaceae bacterium]
MRSLMLLALLPLLAVPARAQHAAPSAAAPSVAAPSAAATDAGVEQLAFLVGEWELVVKPKVTSLAARIHGAPRLLGTWRAWRAFDGRGIEDELRITDASGNPNALVHSLRLFDPATGRWHQTAVDAFRTRITPSTGQWRDGAYHTRSAARESDGTLVIQRGRFHDISADAFTLTIDRSRDGERTWETAALVIEAHRTAARAAR